MKILITGANGLISRKAIRLLSQGKDHQLFATSQKRLNFPPEVNFFTVNLVYSDLNQLIDTIRPEVLIHCAAMASPDACEVDRYSCNKINVEVTARLASACRDYGVHMIFLSTDFVFDGLKGDYTETDTPSPISYYGESKIEAENSIIGLNTGATIVRTSLVYGHDENLSRQNLVLRVIDNLQKGKPYRLPTDQLRAPTDVNDLASALKTFTEKKIGGVFNIVGAQKLSVFDFARQIAAVFGYNESLLIPISASELDEPAKRPLNSSLDITKAKNIIGYKPTPLIDSLKNLKQELLDF
ncbi:MAG: NAD(P)-dependent oxidoreductase [Bacteroidales bacterium]|nr:MAG: NAD(P)-dependent oxidoreductase [Bacteroidales bacterium]